MHTKIPDRCFCLFAASRCSPRCGSGAPAPPVSLVSCVQGRLLLPGVACEKEVI
jgi:hypothetical protein